MYPASPYASPYTQKQRNPLPKVEDVEDDKQSTMSRASGVPRAEHALDSLRLVAGNRVRHARCAPEFLEEIATKGVQDSLKKSSSRKFRIINGSEAKTYFKNYIRDHNKDSEQASRNNNDKITNDIMPSPVVFAVTAWDTGIKCVDYYMTWRVKTKAHHGKEFEQRASLLDSEFRRLARGLDNEYKRISPLRTFGNLSQPHRNIEKSSSHSSRSSHKSPLGSTPEEPALGANEAPLPSPPVSASDSVMSLPLLNMVRGVPFSHRVPLRVTNPDRLSLISEIDIIPDELKGCISLTIPDTKAEVHASNNHTVQVVSRSSKHGREAENAVHESSASIHSADTTSSKSSKSSRSSSRSETRDSLTPEKRAKENHHDSRYEIPEYLIVLLGDKLETESNSWHGLERQTSIRSVPVDRHSPWIGPVAHSENAGHRSSPTRTPTQSDSEESDDDLSWKSTPVIPMKPLMEVMGLFPKSAYYSPPVVPGGLQYQLSVANATSPASTRSPYLYGSPRLDSSAYVPAWLPPIQSTPNAPSSPASRVYSPASYASPYMQTYTGPF